MSLNNQTNPVTAVILAAGMGTRLRDVIGVHPKGLLEIKGKTLIERSLTCLKAFGITQVVMVTGYQEEQYQKALNIEFPEIKFVTNKDYAVTGSMHSLFLAAEYVTSDFLLLESDLLYETRTISSLLNQKDSSILISGKTGSGDEVYIYGESNKITEISKKKIDILVSQGELVGVSRISQNLYKKMCFYYKNQIEFPSDFHYEDCISDLSKNMEINYLKVVDLAWTEIDDSNHYDRALKLIYPRIEENNQKYM